MDEPYYGPEDRSQILFEHMFVAGDLVTGIGYGIQLVLYTSCFIYLWGQKNTRSRTSWILIFYMTLLLIIETIFVAVQARTVQDIYIDNRNYPGGPMAYFFATQDKAINVMFAATLFLLTFLADLLVLWRCWTIWRATLGTYSAYFATAFPVMTLLASFALGTLWTLQSSKPGLSFYSQVPKAFGVSYFWISLSTNILMTILITSRLWWYRRTAMRSLPEEQVREYFSLITIFVESAAIYSMFALVFIITYMVDHPINQIALSLTSSSQQIAGYWIIYRIVKGKAWTQHTFASGVGTSRNPAVSFASTHHRTTNASLPVFAVNGGLSTMDLESTHPSTVETEKFKTQISVSDTRLSSADVVSR
ncbi:hypothetical protein FA15DRAFT_709633 [Coprinopsis marcescibilis]|uniref:Uncharacterized protein n=1 Tax=Coprinopsis marcescibilis TaxID=230819 RepID=A0A5C3KF83_COPMA|nr:hypothetical protein FA15DRAFT_709633 [Coprinopsis marcescibilis]